MTDQQHKFNNGRSSIALAWMPVKTWVVYREDRDVHSGHRAFASYSEALENFQRRVDFVKQMEREA